jgi:hypothetical protein
MKAASISAAMVLTGVVSLANSTGSILELVRVADPSVCQLERSAAEAAINQYQIVIKKRMSPISLS